MKAESEKLTEENEALKDRLMEEKVTRQQLQRENEKLKNDIKDLCLKSKVQLEQLDATSKTLIEVVVELNELKVIFEHSFKWIYHLSQSAYCCLKARFCCYLIFFILTNILVKRNFKSNNEFQFYA